MKENIKINVDGNSQILTVLEGKVLDPKEPVKVNISGLIDAPSKWYLKRKESDNIGTNTHVIVDRENLTIKMVIDENNHYMDTITGRLMQNPDLAAFGINTGKEWTTSDLSKFIKMNRTCFESRDVANDLVKLLNEFKAKINKEVEKNKEANGNYSDVKKQIVNSNIPANFKLCMPVFKGANSVIFEVETYVNPETLTFQLISPDAVDIIKENRDAIFDVEIELLKELTIIEV